MSHADGILLAFGHKERARTEGAMKAERLIREFANRGVDRGDGHLRLRPADALALVDRAAEEGVPIVRIDAADRATGAARSRPEDVADFADGVAHGHGCWQPSEEFIRARRHLDLAFEITLGDDPIEAV